MAAIEESKKDAGPNPDEMSYEQLLELEEKNGKVSKGLTKSDISKIREKRWYTMTDTTKKEDSCSICFEKYKRLDRLKELKPCDHSYHAKCIDEWLTNEKRCPVCNL